MFRQKKTSLLVIISGFVAVWLSTLTSTFFESLISQDNPTNEGKSILPSSVWCNFGPSSERICRFRNICYDSRFQEFQLVLTEESILSGVQRPELWMNIDMSSVMGHNAFRMKIALLSPFNRNLCNRNKFHQTPTFIIHRFKPDNIMHVIHDDLIPLHFTIGSIFDTSAVKENKISLAFSDGYNRSDLDSWYNHFSAGTTTLLPLINGTVCFHDAYVGLLRSTLWFNYGFKQNQGAYLNENFNSVGLRNFVRFNLDAWKANSISVTSQSSLVTKVVILLRSHSRRILNLNTLIEMIKRAHSKMYAGYRLEIVRLDFALHSTTYMLSHIRQAKLFIGMHGAGMILSIFLPRHSGVVELFPFAIRPSHVSFMKALFKQHQRYPLHYESWRNMERRNTIPGPQVDPLMGKISHLPPSIQSHIKNLSEVPNVHCCHDPAYLYYINHDTYVTDKVFPSIIRVLAKTRMDNVESMSPISQHAFPSCPAIVTCEIADNELKVKWSEISNIKENVGFWFQMTVLSGDEAKLHNVTNISSQVFHLRITNSKEQFHVWLQPFNQNNLAGLIKYTKCIRNET